MTFLSLFIPRQHHHFAVVFAVSFFHFSKVEINPTSSFATFSFGFDDVIFVLCALNVHTFSSCNSIYWNASQVLWWRRKITNEKCFLWFVIRKRFVFIHSNPRSKCSKCFQLQLKNNKTKNVIQINKKKIRQKRTGNALFAQNGNSVAFLLLLMNAFLLNKYWNWSMQKFWLIKIEENITRNKYQRCHIWSWGFNVYLVSFWDFIHRRIPNISQTQNRFLSLGK